MGGVLGVARIPGFLTNAEELYELSDTEGAENKRFIEAWWKRHTTTEVGVTELFILATSDEVDLDLPSKTERGQRTQLGHRLASMRDRRYTLTDDAGEFAVRVTLSRVHHSARRWHLALDWEEGSPGSPDLPHPREGGNSAGSLGGNLAGTRFAREPQGNLRGGLRPFDGRESAGERRDVSSAADGLGEPGGPPPGPTPGARGNEHVRSLDSAPHGKFPARGHILPPPPGRAVLAKPDENIEWQVATSTPELLAVQRGHLE
jgi:hypothetical protein